MDESPDRCSPVMQSDTPSLMNEGYSPVPFGDGCSDQIRTLFTDLLALLGKMPEIPEETLDT